MSRYNIVYGEILIVENLELALDDIDDRLTVLEGKQGSQYITPAPGFTKALSPELSRMLDDDADSGENMQGRKKTSRVITVITKLKRFFSNAS